MTTRPPEPDNRMFLLQLADYFQRSEYHYLEISNENANAYAKRLRAMADRSPEPKAPNPRNLGT